MVNKLAVLLLAGLLSGCADPVLVLKPRQPSHYFYLINCETRFPFDGPECYQIS